MEVTFDDWWRDDLQIQIIAAGQIEIGPWWRYDFTPGIAPWRLYRNDRPGSAIQFLDGGVYEIPGEACVLLPTGLQFTTRAWTHVQHFYTHFHLDGFPRLPEPLLRRPVVLGDPPMLRNLIRHAGDDLRGPVAPTALQWRLKVVVLEALTVLFERLRDDRDALELDSSRAPFRHALRFVQDHLDSPIQNEELANRCGMCVSHFIRRFRKEFGMTPAQYVLQYRTRVAAQKLVSAELTLDALAEECGFAHRAHLTRAFRRFFGVTPSAYRDRARRDAKALLERPKTP